MTMDLEKSPRDIVRDLGLDPAIDALVTLIHTNDTVSITEQCLDLAVTMAVAAYEQMLERHERMKAVRLQAKFYGVSVPGTRREELLRGITE